MKVFHAGLGCVAEMNHNVSSKDEKDEREDKVFGTLLLRDIIFAQTILTSMPFYNDFPRLQRRCASPMHAMYNVVRVERCKQESQTKLVCAPSNRTPYANALFPSGAG